MTLFDVVLWLITGAIAGCLAGLITKGRGFGLLGNIAVGIVGAVIGGSLLPLIDFVLAHGFIGGIINAFIGAVIFLLVIGFAKRAA
jgi:uncharacterized membrane protein YeaQ/YmgE (transglycosylase-associated protein family)